MRNKLDKFLKLFFNEKWLDYTCSRLYANLDAFYPLEVKSNCRSSWVNLAFTVFSKIFTSIQLILMTQFFLLLKACSHSVCLHCMRDLFSNEWIEKSYDAIFWVWFLKLKQNTRVNYNKDSVIHKWAEKRKKWK